MFSAGLKFGRVEFGIDGVEVNMKLIDFGG